MQELYNKIQKQKIIVGFIGLGIIGSFLIKAFAARGFTCIGYDIAKEAITRFKGMENISASTDPSTLSPCEAIIACVPTPIDEHHIPHLSCLMSALAEVKKLPRRQRLLVLQSTTYPGTIRDLAKHLSQEGYLLGQDTFLAHVPETEDPGNPLFDPLTLPRIVGGYDNNSTKLASALYAFISRSIFACSRPEIAESAKLLQNLYRLVNISFVNEMKILFDRIDVDIWEVIDAAATKPFGFMPFYPGPGIGGECIPVNPFYLLWKAQPKHAPYSLIETALHVNEKNLDYVLQKIQQALDQQGKALSQSKVLLLGITYKPNVADLRHSPSCFIFHALQSKVQTVDYHDPLIAEYEGTRSIELSPEKLSFYDAVVILVSHSFYDWESICGHARLIIDTQNVAAAHHPKYLVKA